MGEATEPDTQGVQPRGQWVSKSDLVRYLRCPYAFWLLDSRRITLWEFLGWPSARPPVNQAIHQEGLKIAMQALPARYRCEFVPSRESFRHPELKIVGRPYGVLTMDGALFPVEVGTIGDVTRSAKLALAFYWLVLEPYRKVKGLEPRGYILGSWSQPWQTIKLEPRWFDAVLATCNAVREIRRHGARPRICNCTYCGSRPAVARAAIRAGDLTCIAGIDRRRAAKLEQLGLRSFRDLLTVDVEQIGRQAKIPLLTAVSWRAHAQSYDQDRRVIFGEERFEFRDMLVLDLEYGTHWSRRGKRTLAYEPRIWLIGICTVTGSRRKYEFLWADSPGEERRNILTLLERVDQAGSMPIVTWSGRSADLAQLERAIKRLRMRRSLEELSERHVDLLRFSRANVRLPIPGFGLKDVARYFGVLRRSRIVGGRDANTMYGDYLLARSKKRESLRRRLERYNRDDLRCLVEVANRLRSSA